MELKTAVGKLNVARPICSVLVGPNHRFIHRAIVGVSIMVTGVIVAKTVGHHHVMSIAVIGDTLGYGLHGVGLIPFVEALLALE